MAERTACAWRFQPAVERLERRDCPTVPTVPADFVPPPPEMPPPAQILPAAPAPLAPTEPVVEPTYYQQP